MERGLQSAFLTARTMSALRKVTGPFCRFQLCPPCLQSHPRPHAMPVQSKCFAVPFTGVPNLCPPATACHRKVREGQATLEQLRAMLAQTSADNAAGALQWLPVTVSLMERVESVLGSAPSNIFLRAADAIHLACAAEHGFTEGFSNDRHLLAAAPLFGLRGVNVIRCTDAMTTRP
jgi:hypothetical protein